MVDTLIVSVSSWSIIEVEQTIAVLVPASYKTSATFKGTSSCSVQPDGMK